MVSSSVFLDIVTRSASLLKGAGLLLCAWMFSHVAISGGSLAPEMPIIENQKRFDEYPVMRSLQEMLLDLQLLELAVKNRRDPKLEEKISAAMTFIKADGHSLEHRLGSLREQQLQHIERFLQLVLPAEEAATALVPLRNGTFRRGEFYSQDKLIAVFSALRLGKQYVWEIKIAPGLVSKKVGQQRAEQINEVHAIAKGLVSRFYDNSYSRLHASFEEHRYGFIHRLDQARRNLLHLSRKNTSMGVPEETAALYNQVLDHLFAYGMDVSLTDQERDFSVQGFLFAPSPEESRRLYEKLRFVPTNMSYNSSSG